MGNLVRSLWAAVAVLGLAASAVGVASGVGLGYCARLATLAAVVALIELLPERGGRGWLVAALAVAGSVDATCSWVVMHQTGWGEPVILAVSVVQSIAAVAALLAGATPKGTRSESDAAQAAYLAYVQAYYYAAQFGQPHVSSSPGGQPSVQQASATGGSDHDAEEHTATDDAAFAELRERYGRFRPSHDGSATRPVEEDRWAEYQAMPGVDADAQGPTSRGQANAGPASWERHRQSFPPS
jgi:hypothetical protein